MSNRTRLLAAVAVLLGPANTALAFHFHHTHKQRAVVVPAQVVTTPQVTTQYYTPQLVAPQVTTQFYTHQLVTPQVTTQFYTHQLVTPQLAQSQSTQTPQATIQLSLSDLLGGLGGAGGAIADATTVAQLRRVNTQIAALNTKVDAIQQSVSNIDANIQAFVDGKKAPAPKEKKKDGGAGKPKEVSLDDLDQGVRAATQAATATHGKIDDLIGKLETTNKELAKNNDTLLKILERMPKPKDGQ